jgi:hypothetical protein
MPPGFSSSSVMRPTGMDWLTGLRAAGIWMEGIGRRGLPIPPEEP